MPVNYFRLDNEIYCFTDGKWWHNFRSTRSVNLVIRKRKRKTSAIATREDKEQFNYVLSKLIDKFLSDARYYGVKLGDNKKPLANELDAEFDNKLMVKFSNIA